MNNITQFNKNICDSICDKDNTFLSFATVDLKHIYYKNVTYKWAFWVEHKAKKWKLLSMSYEHKHLKFTTVLHFYGY